jgi:16S rRNA (cytosine967-C5)-methyltransferase
MAKPTISPARQFALLVLENVLSRGETLLETLPVIEEKCADPRDRALAREISLGTCRRLGTIRYILDNLAAKFDKFPHPIQRILEMSAYQLLYLEKVPAYAVISEAVNLARYRQMHKLTGAVNGILRTISRDPHAFPPPKKDDDFAAHLSVAESHPAWLIQEWLTIWDKSKVESLCKFNNTHAAVSLRYRTSVSEIEPLLNTFNISYTVDERLPHCLQLEAGSQIKPELFGHGELVAQDPAAMLAASITGAKPGDTIWDICAAPGGKTFYMADQMKNQGKILATDKSEVRLQRLIEQQKQLNITCIETLKMDVVNDSLPLDFTEFDAILVDAPCTGWGTFRKHPDLRWRLHSGDSERLGLLSLQMLEQVKLKVRNGGVLVYSTCTLSPNENEGVVEKFLAKNPNFEIEPVDTLIPGPFREAITSQGFLSLFPPLWNLDGAFAARLKKKP